MRIQAECKHGTAAGPGTDHAARHSLVLGLGATGLSFARWLAVRGESAVFADTRTSPPGVDELAGLATDFELATGEFSLDLLDGVGQVLVSPGIPAEASILAEARRRGLEVLTDIDVFAAEASAPIIAVTGSNGKSTVVSLLAHMFDVAGVDAAPGGNLGTPALELLSQPVPAFYLLELSSFQLERSRTLDTVAATVLNVSPDHLDWHGSFDAYRAAKLKLVTGASTQAINRAEPELAASIERATGERPSVSFGLNQPHGENWGIKRIQSRDWICRGTTTVVALDELYSTATHERLNAMAAMALANIAGLEDSVLASAAKSFQSLPHRAEEVAVIDGVRYVDDSKATNVGAAVASVRSIDTSLVLIAGGDSKGADLGPLAAALAGRLRAAVLIGRAAGDLDALLSPLAAIRSVASMSAAVQTARAFAQPGDTVLLAPACASQDMFRDYCERGEAFVNAVRAAAR